MSGRVALSELDERRFGVVTARGSLASPRELPAILDFCAAHRVGLLIARCDAAEPAAAQAMEAAGGRLMDTLVYFARDLRRREVPSESEGVAVRVASPADAAAVCAIARESFRGYGGHYHADPRLPREQCDETYADWALRSCTEREVADAVLVAVDGAAPIGFLTLRSSGAGEVEIVLNGVLPERQRGGVYRALVIAALGWAKERQAVRVLVSTQVTNAAVQKVWVRLGFEPLRSHHTFHLWFDR